MYYLWGVATPCEECFGELAIDGTTMRDARLFQAFFATLEVDGVRIGVEDQARMRVLRGPSSFSCLRLPRW